MKYDDDFLIATLSADKSADETATITDKVRNKMTLREKLETLSTLLSDETPLTTE